MVDLTQNRIKEILMKPSTKRSNMEIEELEEMIMKIDFFKERNIKNQDLKEIINAFQFEKYNEFENIFEYGDIGEKLYIIIKGLVSVRIPNPSIKDWVLKRKHFMALMEWKREHLDPKIDEAIRKRFEYIEEHRGDPDKMREIKRNNEVRFFQECLKSLIQTKIASKF